jgi:hypothetical protein
MCRNFCALPLAEVAKLMCGTKTTCGAITNELPAARAFLDFVNCCPQMQLLSVPLLRLVPA